MLDETPLTKRRHKLCRLQINLRLAARWAPGGRHRTSSATHPAEIQTANPGNDESPAIENQTAATGSPWIEKHLSRSARPQAFEGRPLTSLEELAPSNRSRRVGNRG